MKRYIGQGMGRGPELPSPLQAHHLLPNLHMFTNLEGL